MGRYGVTVGVYVGGLCERSAEWSSGGAVGVLHRGRRSFCWLPLKVGSVFVFVSPAGSCRAHIDSLPFVSPLFTHAHSTFTPVHTHTHTHAPTLSLHYMMPKALAGMRPSITAAMVTRYESWGANGKRGQSRTSGGGGGGGGGGGLNIPSFPKVGGKVGETKS